METHFESNPPPPSRALRRVIQYPPRLAVLDLGSNSFHLLAADTSPDGAFSIRAHLREQVQLGSDVYRTGTISAETADRATEALLRLRRGLTGHGLRSGIGVATSALREADNGRFFVARASSIMGFPVRMLDGHEEARLVHRGVMQGADFRGKRLAIFDFGGGSTEVVVGGSYGFELATSIPLGALRLQAGSRGTLLTRVRAALQPTLAEVRAIGFDAVVFACGTARTFRRLEHGEAATDRPLTLGFLRDFARRTGETAIEAVGETPPGAVDMLCPGALVFRIILEELGIAAAQVVDTGLREGVLADHLSTLGVIDVPSIT